MRFFVCLFLLPLAASALALGETTCGKLELARRLTNAGYGVEALGSRENAFLELLSDTDVLHNKLDLEWRPSPANLSGTCTITVKSLVPNLTQFTFRLRDNFSISAVKIGTTNLSWVRQSITTCLATLDRAYQVGETFTISITYSGLPANVGLGTFDYGTKSNGAAYAFTLSEPWYSYAWWAGKDSNGDKSTVELHMTVPNTLSVASNGLLQGTDVVAGSKLKYRWKSDYPTAPYLIAFGLTDFFKWTQTWNYLGHSMPVEFFIFPESNTSSNRAGWEASVSMLTTFSNWYGLYPFVDEKYGIYQFTWGGGMEHQTMTGQNSFGESLTAHELAHQWWGNMVTCREWNDLWLNEGFATYSEAVWLEKKPGSSGLAALKSAMSSRRPSSVGDSVYVYDPTNLNRLFSSTYTYRKGAWVLHMLRGVMGDQKFFDGLADYRDAFYMDSAITTDFQAAMEGQYGSSLTWFFNRWVMGIGAPAYQWGWANTTANGKNYLMVHVRQNHSYQMFTMPIDIRPTVGGVKQQYKVMNDATLEHFVIPLTGNATACTFDEDVWILSTGNSNVTYSPGPPKIVQTYPVPGTTFYSGVTKAQVTFHTNVNVNASHITVKNDTTGASVPFSFSYNASTKTVSLVLHRATNGQHTIRISDAVTAADSGMALDGDLPVVQTASALPSGNGTPGGAAEIKFNVLQGPGDRRPPTVPF